MAQGPITIGERNPAEEAAAAEIQALDAAKARVRQLVEQLMTVIPPDILLAYLLELPNMIKRQQGIQ